MKVLLSTLLCSATLILLAAVPVLAQPVISFDEETYDFGDVNQGDVLEHLFVFRNTGNEPLLIEKVTSS